MGTGQLSGPTTDAAAQQSQTDYWNERLDHAARRMGSVAQTIDKFTDKVVGANPPEIGQEQPDKTTAPSTLTEKIEHALAEIDSSITRAENAAERLWATNLVQR